MLEKCGVISISCKRVWYSSASNARFSPYYPLGHKFANAKYVMHAKKILLGQFSALWAPANAKYVMHAKKISK